MRYFLLDRVLEINVGENIKGVKCVTYTDEIMHDHFPEYPILPGAMIIEGLAQLAGLLLETTFNQDESKKVMRAVLVQVDKMKFYNMSIPGDRLEYTAKIDSLLEDAGKVSVEATCDGEKRAQGKITFQMVDIDNPSITAQRMGAYKVWTRGMENCPKLR